MAKNTNKSNLNNFINGQYDNVMVLAGAGSSISSNKSDKDNTGLTMYQLADDVNDKMNHYELGNISNPSFQLYNLYSMAKISNFYKIYNSEFKCYKKKIDKNELTKQEDKIKHFKNIYNYSKKVDIKILLKN